jgi:hypothetical protein
MDHLGSVIVDRPDAAPIAFLRAPHRIDPDVCMPTAVRR